MNGYFSCYLVVECRLAHLTVPSSSDSSVPIGEEESKLLFTKIGNKDKLCVIVVSDASYHYDDKSVAAELMMLGIQKTKKATQLYWRSEVMRKVCISSKAAETRSLLRLMDDGIHMEK